MSEIAGDACVPEYEQAWAEAFAIVAAAMLEGANSVETADAFARGRGRAIVGVGL